MGKGSRKWSENPSVGHQMIQFPSLLRVGSLMTSQLSDQVALCDPLSTQTLGSNWHSDSSESVTQHPLLSPFFISSLPFLHPLALLPSPPKWKSCFQVSILNPFLFLFYTLSQVDLNHSMILTITYRPTFPKLDSSQLSLLSIRPEFPFFFFSL